MQIDTIYDLIMNVPLFHILHVRSVYICGTQNEIMKKCINNVSTQELDSTNKRWIYVYKESMNLMHVWINFNASTHDMTGKERKYENQIVSAIITIPQFTNEKKLWIYNFRLWIIMTSTLILCLLLSKRRNDALNFWGFVRDEVTPDDIKLLLPLCQMKSDSVGSKLLYCFHR